MHPKEEPIDIHPTRIYTADEVARYLKIRRKEVYAIPEELLPKRRVGARGGAVRYAGHDVLRYAIGYEDLAA